MYWKQIVKKGSRRLFKNLLQSLNQVFFEIAEMLEIFSTKTYLLHQMKRSKSISPILCILLFVQTLWSSHITNSSEWDCLQGKFSFRNEIERGAGYQILLRCRTLRQTSSSEISIASSMSFLPYTFMTAWVKVYTNKYCLASIDDEISFASRHLSPHWDVRLEEIFQKVSCNLALFNVNLFEKFLQSIFRSYFYCIRPKTLLNSHVWPYENVVS